MAGVVCPLTPPRGWPRRIRSAAVHAVSLAEFALTAALGWAAQSLNPRLRLRAELERLRQEIQLLREEIRIKDSRMTHIDPRSGPTIHRRRGWRSSSCGRHTTGLSLRPPEYSSSLPSPSHPGWCASTRMGHMLSPVCLNR